jgi:hypothetical protein
MVLARMPSHGVAAEAVTTCTLLEHRAHAYHSVSGDCPRLISRS